MIEIDRNIYKAFTLLEFGDIITFIEFQEEDLDISNGWNESDNKVYALFHYKNHTYKRHPYKKNFGIEIIRVLYKEYLFITLIHCIKG